MAAITNFIVGLVPWLCVLIIIYAIGLTIYNIYFHPLARFPGPFLGKISNFHTYRAIVNQNRMLTHTQILEQYGSPTRIGPNELIFSDLRAFKDIHGYSSQQCLKDPAMYSLLTATGAVSLISATGKKDHARLRRILTPGFALQELLRSESLIAEKVDLFMNLVFEKSAGAGAVDILDKIQEHHLDLVSQLSFGESFNTLSGDTRASHRDVDVFLDVVPAIAFFPAIKYLPIKAIRDGQEGLARLQRFSRDAILGCINSIEKGDNSNAQRSFLKGLITAVDPETGTKLTIEELVENTIIFLVAGTDTTAMVTTYTLWEVARNSEIRKKLVKEIRAAFPNPDIMPTYREASKLPYFSAILEETLRLYGPSNIAVPRLSPGRTIGKDNHYIPEGTVVSTSPYAMVRNPEIFPNPNTYDPDRWISRPLPDGDGYEPTREMRESSRPFGYGPRGCVARYFAEVSFTLTLVRLFQLFDVTSDPDRCGMTEEMMRQRDRGVLTPWGMKLVVEVERAGSGGERRGQVVDTLDGRDGTEGLMKTVPIHTFVAEKDDIMLPLGVNEQTDSIEVVSA